MTKAFSETGATKSPTMITLQTPQEAADLLGISTLKVKRLATCGKLPAIRLNERTFRFKLEELEPFMLRPRALSQESVKRGRFRNRKDRHHCTDERFDEMHAQQDGRCAICGAKPDRLKVDHNHATEDIRGLLCTNCNAGLGMFLDSPYLLRRAIMYLRKALKFRQVKRIVDSVRE